MQQRNITPGDGEQHQEPDWTLASYGQRVGAWALDFIGAVLSLILLVPIIGAVWVLGRLFASETIQIVAAVVAGCSRRSRHSHSRLHRMMADCAGVGADTGQAGCGHPRHQGQRRAFGLGLHILARVRHQVSAGGRVSIRLHSDAGGLPLAAVG